MYWRGRGTVYSSIWLLIEEAGMVGFVIFFRGLPCAWLRFVCKTGRWGCMIVQFVLRRKAEYSSMWLVVEGTSMVKFVGA